MMLGKHKTTYDRIAEIIDLCLFSPQPLSAIRKHCKLNSNRLKYFLNLMEKCELITIRQSQNAVLISKTLKGHTFLLLYQEIQACLK